MNENSAVNTTVDSGDDSAQESKAKSKISKFQPIMVISKNTAKRRARACLVGQELHKAIATQDASRFIGKWIVLEAGKEIEAPQYVIENLRKQKLVE